jgi:hypothetical protein
MLVLLPSAHGAGPPGRSSRSTRPQQRAARRIARLFAILTAFANGYRDDRRRGGVERRPGLPETGEQERGGDARRDGVLAVGMFVGITLLAHAYVIVPSDTETVVSQIARAVFSGRGWPHTRFRPGPCSSWCSRRTLAYADFRDWRRSCRAIATSRGSS